jgi:haloacid dehalogenase-like hydrolase
MLRFPSTAWWLQLHRILPACMQQANSIAQRLLNLRFTRCFLLRKFLIFLLPFHPQSDGHTCVMVAVEGRLAAAVSLFDPVKPEARGVVTALHRAGLQCHLLTGDNRCVRRLGSCLMCPGRLLAVAV